MKMLECNVGFQLIADENNTSHKDEHCLSSSVTTVSRKTIRN